MKSFSYHEAMEFYTGLDSYFGNDRIWWFAIKNWMDSNGFLSFPASSRYHLYGKGGLLRHTMNVVRNLFLLNDAWDAGYKKWELSTVGTLHDIGKMGVIKPDGEFIPRYIEIFNIDQETVPGQAFAYNKDCPKWSPVLYSLLLTRKFVHLPFELEEAIAHHDHRYITENMDRGHREGTLELLLHYSDYYAGHVLESGITVG